MPGMPFHLEKGHALMALEDLLNDDKHHAVVHQVFEGVRSGTPLGQVFADALATAPILDQYAGHAGTAGLGAFVSGAWFGQATTPGAQPYWLDYEGDVDGIVREALLLAMETAWGVSRSQPLPASVDRSRRIVLLWHCAQRWFDAWVTWDSPDGPVTLLFATPPHTGGKILDRIDGAVSKGWAQPVDASSVAAEGDMVLVCQERNLPAGPRRSRAAWTGLGSVLLPPIGRGTVGSGAVQAHSISADAGGARPATTWR